ncbi:MAG: acyl-CoA thioesterase [Gemmatimonadetes bacterium]|nr:acyl-CoA thioesterase [Gemmatimonadota bacterium]
MIPTRKSVSELRVRYAETDQMGVVYHTHYLVWCEVGRTDWIREFGLSYAELERQGVALAVADVHIRYVASARYDDLVRVTTWLEKLQSRALTFGYELSRIDESGASSRIATATTQLIALDRAGAPCRLPRLLVDRLREEPVPLR